MTTLDLLGFGPFRLDAARRLLWRDGELVALAPRAIDVLAALARQPGQVVSKQELLEQVWPDTFVEEANLSVNVSALRKTLGSQPGGRPYIETVARRGYRFVPVTHAETAMPGSLAVLPFRSLDGAKGDEALGIGLADALITRLGRIGVIQVRPTGAVLRYAASGCDPQQAGRELQVDVVLDARLQRMRGQVRATAQLVNVADGHPIWAEAFDEPFTNLLAVEDTLSERVARALTERLGKTDRARLTRRETRSSEAYEAHLRGRYFWNKLTGPWLEKARQAFEQAVAKDPRYALAHAGLADTCTLLGLFGLLQPAEAWSRARAAAERALSIDDSLAEAHISLAYVRLFQDWAWAEAEKELERALNLSPTSAEVRQWHALFLAMTGRFEEAMAQVQRAQELDPVSLTVRANVGFHLYLIHDSAAEIEHHRGTLEMEPDYAVGHWALALAYEQEGNHREAISANRKAVELSGGSVIMKANLARSYALAGQRREALGLLGELTALGPTAHVSPYRIATVHLALGDARTAIFWLQKACEARDHWMVWLKVDPMLEPLRSDPSFARLVARVGFPAERSAKGPRARRKARGTKQPPGRRLRKPKRS